jgi:hypothetical protein
MPRCLVCDRGVRRARLGAARAPPLLGASPPSAGGSLVELSCQVTALSTSSRSASCAGLQSRSSAVAAGCSAGVPARLRRRSGLAAQHASTAAPLTANCRRCACRLPAPSCSHPLYALPCPLLSLPMRSGGGAAAGARHGSARSTRETARVRGQGNDAPSGGLRGGCGQRSADRTLPASHGPSVRQAHRSRADTSEGRRMAANLPQARRVQAKVRPRRRHHAQHPHNRGRTDIGGGGSPRQARVSCSIAVGWQ